MCDEDLIRSNRDLVIAAAMSHVAFDGWTWKAIKTGAIDAGFTEADAARLFIGGLGDAADHFADWADRRMVKELNNIDLGSMRIRDRIYTCIQLRIRMNTPHKEALRRLMSFLTLPTNAGLLAKSTWRTCSRIWYAAGDTSTDWNYYSKRGLLASVYSSTILYWMSDPGDKSGDFPDTWGFLERRIDNVLKTFGLPKKFLANLGELTRHVSRCYPDGKSNV